MIDGIDANSSVTVLKVSANFLGAIFAMNNAVNTPTGSDIKSDNNAISRVYKMIKPMAYWFELKDSPISQVLPVKNLNGLTAPNPPLFVIKGVTPFKMITPATINMNELDSKVNDKRIPLVNLSICFLDGFLMLRTFSIICIN